MLDASLPRRGVSDNAREILRYLHANADRDGRGLVSMRDIERVAMCGRTAALSALYELPAAGDVATLKFVGDHIQYQVVGRDAS